MTAISSMVATWVSFLGRTALATLLVIGSPTAIPRTQTGTGAANSYYVDSVHGSDKNAGTAPDAPWQTLARLQAHKYAPGDTVYLARGSAWDTNLYIQEGGTAEAPVTFRAFGTGARPTITPTAPGDRPVTVDAPFIVLDGLRLSGGTSGGVNVTRAAHHVTVQNMEIFDVAFGVEVYGANNIITRNYIHHLKPFRNTPGGNDDYGANGVLLATAGNQVTRNRFYRCIGPSYDHGAVGAAVELFGQNADDNRIMYNYAIENGSFVEAGGGSARNTVVAYNVAHNNNGRFAWFYITGPDAAAVENVRIHNNTVVEVLPAVAPGVLWFGSSSPPKGLIVRNNIFYLNRVDGIATNNDFTHDHNLYYVAGSGSRLGLELGPSEKVANPRFESVTEANFRLSDESPAVGAGIPLGYEFDFANLRLSGRRPPDLGAYQYVQLHIGSVCPRPPAGQWRFEPPICQEHLWKVWPQ